MTDELDLTPARRKGLDVLETAAERGVDARVSNQTSALEGRESVYWQTADWLVEQGLAVRDGDDLRLADDVAGNGDQPDPGARGPVAAIAAGGELQHVPVDAIDPDPDNERGELHLGEGFVQSIRDKGILQPLTLRPRTDAGRWPLVHGHRRLAGAIEAGLDTVPCWIRGDLEDGGARAETRLVENLHREDLAPSEEARGYRRLTEDYGYTQRDLADKVGKTQSHISRRLALLDLPDDVLQEVDAGGITIEDGRTLTKLADHPDRLQAALDTAAGTGWKSIPEAVNDELEELRCADRRTEVIDELNRERPDVAVVEIPEARGEYAVPRVGDLRLLGDGWDRLGIAEQKHRHEDCHAIAVIRDGTTLPVCTDPDGHPDPPPSDAERERIAEQQQREQRARALSAAAKARSQWLAEHLDDLALDELSAGHDTLLRHTLDVLLYASHKSTIKLAAGLLDVDPVVTEGEWGTNRDYLTPLTDLADDGRLAAVVTALWAATFEDRRLHRYRRGWSEDVAGYLQVLEEAGYDVTDAERDKLAGGDDT